MTNLKQDSFVGGLSRLPMNTIMLGVNVIWEVFEGRPGVTNLYGVGEELANVVRGV